MITNIGVESDDHTIGVKSGDPTRKLDPYRDYVPHPLNSGLMSLIHLTCRIKNLQRFYHVVFSEDDN